MKSVLVVLGLALVVATVSAQRRPPNYSQDEMPDTSFNCRDKVVGGYYADQETDCQMFHVCVKVPGLGVQDYRFLCPNDTTFDQENQICANWYDIDCEASTLFYSDNFDLYRINKAPSSKGTPIPLGPSTQRPPAALPKKRPVTDRDDDEEEFYLQRSETGDRRLQKDLLRGSSSGNFFNKNKGKEDDFDDDYKPPQLAKKPVDPIKSVPRRGPPAATYIEADPNADNNNATRKKVAVRKLRKRPQNANVDANAQQSYEANPTTYPPSTTTDRYVNRQNLRQSQLRTQDFQRTQTSYEPQKSAPSSTTLVQAPSTAAPTFADRTTRAQFQQRYNTITRNNGQASSTTTTTTEEPNDTAEIQAQINNFQSRNNRPRFNAQRVNNNFASKATTKFVEATISTEAPTTKNFYSPSTRNYNQQPSTFNQQRGFENQKTNAVPSTTLNYQNSGFSSTNNNVNSGAYNKAVGDFARSTAAAYTTTTIAPVTFTGSYKPAKVPVNAREYNDYNGNFDSYGNQRSQESSDEYVENVRNGEEEFLKTAPSNNIRPSNFNNFRKQYTEAAVTNENAKSTTNFNYESKNGNDFNKITTKNYNYRQEVSTTRRPTTQFYQSTAAQSVNNSPTGAPARNVETTNYYQPSSYRPVPTTTTTLAPPRQYVESKPTAAPRQYVESKPTAAPRQYVESKPAAAAAAIKKAVETKVGKSKDYDYAYYDDTEYEGADPISDHHFGVAGESQRISK